MTLSEDQRRHIIKECEHRKPGWAVSCSDCEKRELDESRERAYGDDPAFRANPDQLPF